MIEVELPDGRIVEIETTDPTVAASAAKKFMGSQKAPVDPIVDVAKSTGIGAAKSIIGLADIPELGARGIQAGVNLVQRGLGLEQTERPGTRSTFAERFDGGPEPLTPAQAIQSKIEETTGPFYKPQTYAGEWAETIGGFLPAAATGPGGIATRIATQAVAPALATEGAGYLTRGTSFETPARIVASVTAGPAAARTVAGRGAKLPSAEELKQAYRDVTKNPQLRSTPVNTQGLSQAIQSKLHTQDYDPLNSPRAFERVAHINTYQNPTVGDLIDLRQKMAADARGFVVSSPTQMHALDSAKREIDDFLSSHVPDFRTANRNYAAAKTVDTLQGKRDQAHYRSMSANSGQNESNQLRSRAADILLSPKLRRGFNKGQLKTLQEINEGSKIGNTARYFGNLLGGGGGMGQVVTALGLGGGGYALGGQEGAAIGLGVTAAGRGLKGIERASTRRQMDALDKAIRASAPLAQNYKKLPKMERDAIVRALLQSSAARQSEQ